MSDQDVLSQVNTGNPDPVVTSPAPTESAIPEGYSELIGEGKKYKTVTDALNSLPHAQQHISKLEQEMAELRGELEKRETAEEILRRIEAGKEGGDTNQPEIDPDAIAQYVKETVHTLDKQKIMDSNRNSVNQKLIETYGDAAVEVVKAKAKELGLSQDDLNKMASQSPNAFYRVIGIDSPQPTEGGMNMHSSVNTDKSAPVPQSGPQEGTYSWWQAQKKERGDSWFYSTKVQSQYHQSAIDARDKGKAW